MITNSSFDMHRQPDVVLFAKEVRPLVEAYVRDRMDRRSRRFLRQWLLDERTLRDVGVEAGICKTRVRAVIDQEIGRMHALIATCFGDLPMYWLGPWDAGFLTFKDPEYVEAFTAVLAEVL